jgi:2-hydroxychromene-2-carboxylate isomerase
MPRRIDYYFSMVSPWAYIGHAIFTDLVRRHDVAVTYRPVSLGDVFAETGGLPLPKRHPVRQRYRLCELQRWREKRALKFQLRPKNWPFNAERPDRFVLAMIATGKDPGGFMQQAFTAIWEKEENLADEATLVRLADQTGHKGSDLLLAANADATKSAYEQNFKDALAADVFGSPAYVLDGEVFWGQDRLELLDDALTSRRAPYRSDV